MCLLDTIDGALMLSLYIQPAANFLPPKQDGNLASDDLLANESEDIHTSPNHRDPVAFLYYSIVLTTLTVMVAIVIGIIQLLTLVLNVAGPTGRFWDGVQTAGDYYDAIGGGICGCFLIVGICSVFLYKPWRRWMARHHGLPAAPVDEESAYHDNFEPDNSEATEPVQPVEPADNNKSPGAKGTVSQVTVTPAGESSR